MNWAQAYKEVVLEAAETPGKEWLTLSEVGKLMGMRSPCSIRSRIAAMIAGGQAERRKFKIDRAGRIMDINHYKLTKKKK